MENNVKEKLSTAKAALAELGKLDGKGGTLVCEATSKKSIRIEELYADQPGAGWGLRTLRKITEILDRHQCMADCILDQDSETGVDRLRRLYQHFGFRDSGFLKLTREPNPENAITWQRSEPAHP